MGVAGLGDLLGAVALGEHHQRAARGLELLDVRIHAAGGGRAERSRCHALGGLGRARVVHRVVLQVFGHRLAGLEALGDLRVRDVARHHQRAGQRQPGLDRVLGEFGEDLVHRPVQVDLDHGAALDVLGDTGVGHVLRRIGLQLLQEDAVGGDLAERLAVGRARHRDRHRARRAVARQPDHADVVAEVLAAELRTDAEGLGQLEDLLLQRGVAETVAGHVALGRQIVQVVRRRVLGGLERELGGGAADHHGEVVRRAGRGAQRADLLVQEGEDLLGVQDRLGLLEQERLVGRAAALGHEQELVLGSLRPLLGRVDLHLRGQVGAGVLLVVHGQRCELRVAQVQLGVRVVDAAGDPLAVVDAGEHALALLAHHDRGAGVLAHRQHPAGRDVDVLEEVERDEAVVARGLRVVDDLPQLAQMGRAQVVADVVNRLGGELPQGLRIHLQEGPAVDLDGRDALAGDQAIRGVVVIGGQQIGVEEFGGGG